MAIAQTARQKWNLADARQNGRLRPEQMADFLPRIEGQTTALVTALQDGSMVMVNQGENSKLPGVREIAQRVAVLLADKGVTWESGPAPVWWKRTWKAIRSAVRSDRRRADRDVIEEEQIDFMQRELVLPIGANRMPDEYAFRADDP